MHPVVPYVIAALLFGVGVYGVLVRRNAVLMLMSVELMLNAVNLVFVTADTTAVGLPASGQVFALFVIVLAAAEIGVGLAVILRFFRLRGTVVTDRLGDAADDTDPAAPATDAAEGGAAGRTTDAVGDSGVAAPTTDPAAPTTDAVEAGAVSAAGDEEESR